MKFKDEEKIRLFDKLEELYFRKNFGSVSKTDLETLLFSEYIECCIRNNVAYDDYSLSKALGITQSRIRILKERKELKYPLNDDPEWWKIPFANAIKNAKYDEKNHSVKFIVQDVNVMNEVRHYIEMAGWYDDCSLNRKLLNIPLDCFTEICIGSESLTKLFSDKEKKALRAISKDRPDVLDFVENFSIEGLKSFLMSASKESIGIVLKALPFGGVAKIAFSFLGQVIAKM